MRCIKCDKPVDQQGHCAGCSTATFAAKSHFDVSKEVLLAKIRELAMDPLLQEDAAGDEWNDKTVDAYFRGQASGIDGACMRIEEALAGHHHGSIAHQRLQALCDLIHERLDPHRKASK